MKKLLLVSAILLISASCNVFNAGVLGMVKTLDGGASWKASNAMEGGTGNISTIGISEIAFAPGDTQKIYISALNSGLLLSTNGGDSWRQLLSKIMSYDFVVDNMNSSKIYVVGTYNKHGKIIRTTDGGVTWQEVYNEATIDNPVTSITVNTSNNQEMYAMLYSGVLIKSIDGGTSWVVVHDFKDYTIHIRYYGGTNTLYALLRNKGLAESTDGGVTWNLITSQLTQSTSYDVLSLTSSYVSTFTKMSLDDQSGGVIYITTDKGLYKTIDNGITWTFIKVPIKSNDLVPRAIASLNGGMIAYTSIGNTLYKTLDGGQSWQTQELPTTNVVSKILIDPNRPQVTYAALVNP